MSLHSGLLDKSIQTRGELIAIAHMVRLIDLKLERGDPAKKPGLDDMFDALKYELERLIGNQFQMRTDIGCPVQLAKVILLMAGEESE